MYYIFVLNGKYVQYEKSPYGNFSLPYLFTFYKFFHNSPSNSSRKAAVHILGKFQSKYRGPFPFFSLNPVVHVRRHELLYLFEKIILGHK